MVMLHPVLEMDRQSLCLLGDRAAGTHNERLFGDAGAGATKQPEWLDVFFELPVSRSSKFPYPMHQGNVSSPDAHGDSTICQLHEHLARGIRLTCSHLRSPIESSNSNQDSNSHLLLSELVFLWPGSRQHISFQASDAQLADLLTLEMVGEIKCAGTETR